MPCSFFFRKIEFSYAIVEPNITELLLQFVGERPSGGKCSGNASEPLPERRGSVRDLRSQGGCRKVVLSRKLGAPQP